MAGSLCIVGHLMLPLLTGGREPVVGGAEVQMFHLAAALQARGWRNEFLVCALDGRDAGTIATTYGTARVLYARRQRKSPADKWREKRRLWTAIRASGSELVFQRAVWDADIAAAAARHRGLPYVYALASDRDAVALPAWSRRRTAIRLATAIVAQSESQRDWMHRYGRDAECIPSGFPLPAWSPAPRETILWAGTLRALKRPQVFLDLAAAFPHQAFVLCGGPGEDAALAAAVATRAAGLPNVHDAGFVPYAEMAAHFARARLLVNTSTYEGFPNTFILAWLHGALVVSLGVDPDGLLSRHGLGVAARDVRELHAAIARAIREPAWVADTVARARAYAERRHDIESVASAYAAVFAAARAGS
jgi:glycosyltransferase involved in cell wall biosynthesis